jgi:hypothetical protein
MESLVRRVAKEGWVLDDIQPGDFMLTPDGRVVPLDMRLRTKPVRNDTKWERDRLGTDTILREVLERLYKVYEHQRGRPPTKGL